MTQPSPFGNLLREIILAGAMIGILVLGLWAHTGSMPPLVVVESSSMIHDIDGEVGSIDAGDLILVRDSSTSIISHFMRSQVNSSKKTMHEAEKSELRIYGMGAQILNELDVKKMILLTNTDWKFIGLDAYGIDIVEKKFLSEIQ